MIEVAHHNLIKPTDWRWTYFSPAKLACPHCQALKIDPVLLDYTTAVRIVCGFPFPETSGYRCPVHNQDVSSTGPTGPHTTGKALDLGLRGQQAYKLLSEALNHAGFTGVGVKQHGTSRFIHLDIIQPAPGVPRPTVWSYP